MRCLQNLAAYFFLLTKTPTDISANFCVLEENNMHFWAYQQTEEINNLNTW